jgi:hypothetical protein
VKRGLENYIHRALSVYDYIEGGGKKWEVLGLRLPLFFIQQFFNGSLSAFKGLRTCSFRRFPGCSTEYLDHPSKPRDHLVQLDSNCCNAYTSTVTIRLLFKLAQYSSVGF